MRQFILCSFFTFISCWIFAKEVVTYPESALVHHLENISESPHAIGTTGHEEVFEYISEQLVKWGIPFKVQESLSERNGTFVKVKNVFVHLPVNTEKGFKNNKGVLLMSHYDSALGDSKGTSDAGVGIAVLLETIHLWKDKKRGNPLYFLFSDAEEVGLLGANAFVKDAELVKEIGLVINLEARGTSGKPFLFIEASEGNKELVHHLQESKVKYVKTNSLLYDVYKLLPNNTDLTVFHEKAKIPGYNLAFIEGHTNYHTAQDDINHLDIKTLFYQWENVNALITYFSSADLSKMSTESDQVFFQFYGIILSWAIWVVYFVFGCLFIGSIGRMVYLYKKSKLFICSIIWGYFLHLLILMVVGLVLFYCWKGLLDVYPSYKFMLDTYPYEVNTYILIGIVLSIVIYLFISRFIKSSKINLSAGNFLFWSMLSGVLFWKLPGTGYLVMIPLLSFLGSLVEGRNRLIIGIINSIVLYGVVGHMLVDLPIALSLMVLPLTGLLTITIFYPFITLLVKYQKLSMVIIFLGVLSCGFLFLDAHTSYGYAKGKAKPNNMVYFQDTEKAYWLSMDPQLDEWTSTIVKDTVRLNPLTDPFFPGWYRDGRIGKTHSATNKEIQGNVIHVTSDEAGFHQMTYHFNEQTEAVTVYRKDTIHPLESLVVNGLSVDISIKKHRLFTYYKTIEDSIRVSWKGQINTLNCYQISRSSWKKLSIPERPPYFMAGKYSDRVILKNSIIVNK